MAAKDVRNLILGLVILIIGIFVLTRIGSGFISGVQLPATIDGSSSIVDAVKSVSTLLMLGLGIIVVFLIPFYLAKRSSEKKLKKYAAPPPPQPQQQKK